MSDALEFNFDGLVGPTHNYAGLAQGNLASQQNRHLVSHPRQAALQGLEKMKFLADLGIPQAVLPPQQRPDIAALRRFGFGGTDADILAKAARDAPDLLAACASASSMWAANAATISPSADTDDHRLHITSANLISHLHRSLEAAGTSALLRAILPGPRFCHHPPLLPAPETADEGAANHSRLCMEHGGVGLEMFTFGDTAAQAGRFGARQARRASEAIARLHRLRPERTFFLQQHLDAIHAGVFHNDVIAVAHRHILLYHERAYVDSDRQVETLRRAFNQVTGGDLLAICIPDALLPLADAVRSYFFNSQLVTLPHDGAPTFIAPAECRDIPTAAAAALDLLRQKIPRLAVHFVDVRQSMLNGGGPACLRLRIVLTPEEQAGLYPGVRLTETLYQRLHEWIQRHYRESLSPADLADPRLLSESRAALAELAGLGLPAARQADECLE